MKKKEPINAVSLGTAIASLVIGIILFLNHDILKIIGYIVSVILLCFGIFKLLVTLRRKKKGIDVEFGDYFAAFMAMLFAVLIAIFPNSIQVSLSLVLGTLALLFGVNRLIFGLTIRKIDDKGSKMFVCESLLVIILGILIISQKFLSLLGLFLIIYAIFELVSYVYYKINDHDYDQVLNKKISKEIKESKSIEAVVDEKQ